MFSNSPNSWHNLRSGLNLVSSAGAQIIDLMMLVVDVVKGVQTQTAECLLIGELTCPRMVVVLNKTDLLPADKRQAAIEKMTKRLHKTLENTRCAFNTSPGPSREMLCSLTVVATQPVTGLSTCCRCPLVHILSPSLLALTHTAHTGPIGFHFSICFVNSKPNKEIKMAVFFSSSVGQIQGVSSDCCGSKARRTGGSWHRGAARSAGVNRGNVRKHAD